MEPTLHYSELFGCRASPEGLSSYKKMPIKDENLKETNKTRPQILKSST